MNPTKDIQSLRTFGSPFFKSCRRYIVGRFVSYSCLNLPCRPAFYAKDDAIAKSSNQDFPAFSCPNGRAYFSSNRHLLKMVASWQTGKPPPATTLSRIASKFIRSLASIITSRDLRMETFNALTVS
jgi:hypothetical protein